MEKPNNYRMKKFQYKEYVLHTYDIEMWNYYN